ncbi:hypothetical protein BH09PSE1_BH09PSE1_18830 [soil metagenome]
MARRLSVQRLMLVMGALVLALGALSAWVVYTNARPPAQPTADQRAVRQVREQRGRGFDVRYAEAGRGRAVCGYAGPRNRDGGAHVGGLDAVAFVSRPNRILFSDDPLPVEFREMQQRFCPGFLANPIRPVS